MCKKIFNILISLLILLFFLVSCNDKTKSGSESIINKTYGLEIRMHDAPLKISGVDVEKVVVEIIRIEAHHEELGWITLSEEKKKFDLLELQDGITAIIFKKPLELGTYTQIRLILNENNEIFVKRLPYRLNIPSGEQTGIKLITPFTIQKGKMVEVTLDFDVEKSIIYTSKGFKLKPVIKVEEIEEHDGAGIISEKGGLVSSLDYSVSLKIPESAIPEGEILTINEVSPVNLAKPADEAAYLGKIYDFEPDGMTFQKPVILIMRYDLEELSKLGLAENIKLQRYNEETQKWDEIPAFVSIYNFVFAQINHFSKYVLTVTPTCYDQISNGSESVLGVDCGGNCPAACVNCNLQSDGQGIMAPMYSLSDNAVYMAAQEALTEYAIYKSVDVDTLNTASKKMEAVAYYVDTYMKWVWDEDGDWNGLQSAVRTVRDSKDRIVTDYAGIKNKCTEFPTKYGKKAKYCGDCEDFALLRAALLRHLKVYNECIVNADYYEFADANRHVKKVNFSQNDDIPFIRLDDIPSVQPEPYDYLTAKNLFESVETEGSDSTSDNESRVVIGGHVFNLVLYYNKWRIMDYGLLGKYFDSRLSLFSLKNHQVFNLWNDHFGRCCSLPADLSKINLIHNYPGLNKCYQPDKSEFTHYTFYTDICR